MSHRRLRIAASQFKLQATDSFEHFMQLIEGQIKIAMTWSPQVVVLPEYSTACLLPGEMGQHLPEKFKNLGRKSERYFTAIANLAQRYQIHLVGGTHPHTENNFVYNEAPMANPDGSWITQGKIHLTRFESEEWHMSPRTELKIWNTSLGKFAVAICYDVEFPEQVRTLAREGIEVLLVPSCTDDRYGFYRVRHSCLARALENQCYVVQSLTVGGLQDIPDFATNYGQAGIFAPCDFPFPGDGVLAQGEMNQDQWVVADVDLAEVSRLRRDGTVRTWQDGITTGSYTVYR